MSSDDPNPVSDITHKLDSVELSDSDADYESADDAEPEVLDDHLTDDEGESTETRKPLESDKSDDETDRKSDKEKKAEEKAKEMEKRKEAEDLLSEEERNVSFLVAH